MYQELYQIFSEQGDYNRGLHGNLVDAADERLVEHICIAYNAGWENLQPGNLIWILVNEGTPAQLEKLESFFPGLGKKEGGPNFDKIKDLWGSLYNVLKERIGEHKEYVRAVAELAGWLEIIETIDSDIKEWMKLSARHVKMVYEDMMLLEQMAGKIMINPKPVAEIYLEMLNSGAYPDYQDYHKTIVEHLYQSGYKGEADIICNKYAAHGDHSLRELYDKHNKS